MMTSKSHRILITGGAGFIGSNLVKFLNAKGIIPFVYDPKLTTSEQWKNLAGLNFIIVDNPFLDYSYNVIVHLGATSATTSPMTQELFKNNFIFSQELFFAHFNAKFIYASSAATYGAEKKDFTERVDGLRPNNAYGFLKLQFDKWILNRPILSKGGVGLRFFNCYGPKEDFKDDMASVVHKAINKIYPLVSRIHREHQTFNLFKSSKTIKRDFVFVEDVCKVIWFFIENDAESGIYNVGCGKARSFVDLVRAVDPTTPINYVKMPDALKSHYQFFTEANLDKLRKAGYKEEFTSLENGIKKMKEAK